MNMGNNEEQQMPPESDRLEPVIVSEDYDATGEIPYPDAPDINGIDRPDVIESPPRNWLRRHFWKHARRRPWSFCWRITLEGLLVSFIITLPLAFVMDESPRIVIDFPLWFIVPLAVLVAPIFETLFLQTMPIGIIRLFRGSFVLQIIISTLAFALAHIPEGFTTAISAGLVGGFYFAFTYAHWRRKSIWTAYWVTALGHGLRNGFAMMFLAGAMLASDYEGVRYTEINGFDGTARIQGYCFNNPKGDPVFAIGSQNGMRGIMSPSLMFKPGTIMDNFEWNYDGANVKAFYDPDESTLRIDGKDFTLSEGVLFYLETVDGKLKIQQHTLESPDTPPDEGTDPVLDAYFNIATGNDGNDHTIE